MSQPQMREVTTQRFEVGGIPAHGAQKSWAYTLHEDNDGRYFRISDGRRAFGFRPADRDEAGHLALTRLPDIGEEELQAGDKPIQKGLLQVHRSTPGAIYGTLQNGRNNVTFQLVEQEGKWKLIPGRQKPSRMQALAGFVNGVTKTANPVSFFTKLTRKAAPTVIPAVNNATRQVNKWFNPAPAPATPAAAAQPAAAPVAPTLQEGPIFSPVASPTTTTKPAVAPTAPVPPTPPTPPTTKQAGCECPKCNQDCLSRTLSGGMRCTYCGTSYKRVDPYAKEGAKFEESIAVDLDGTLAWSPDESFLKKPGKPIKPMMEAVRKWIADGKTVKIFTARAHDPKQIRIVRKWLSDHGLPKLTVTNVKDPGMKVVIDDRAVGIEKNKGFVHGQEKSHEKLNKVSSIRDVILGDIAAADKATLKNPSKKQQEAGNYRKGKVRLHGLEVAIETPAGTTRSGTSKSGKDWSITLKNSYGYIVSHARSEADGDHIDIFLGPHPESEVVFVVDQQIDGKFDEHKVMLGWTNAEEAKKAYHDNYSEGWKGFQSITALTMKEFKDWISSGKTHKPLAGQKLSKVAAMMKIAPSHSASQQRLFGMVHAYQKGKLKNAPDKIKQVASHISAEDARDFAKTKHEGLPEKKEAMPDPNTVRAGLLYPINAANPWKGVAAGAAMGALAGAGLHGLGKVKRWIMGDDEYDEQPSLGKTMAVGALGGAGISGMAQLAGQNPYNVAGLHKISGFESQRLRDAILADTTLPSWKQMQLLQQIAAADSSGIPMSPDHLAGVGLSALAGWLIGRAAGFGTIGSAITGFGGAAIGNALFKPPSGTIIGQGFYRP